MPEADKAYQADKIAVQVDGRSLALTNLAKVLYPADGFTKAEVLDYYQRISPVLLPHIAGRPMTLRRFPHGVRSDQPGQGALPGRRLHQGRGPRLLPADLPGAAAAHRRPPDDAPALPARRPI